MSQQHSHSLSMGHGLCELRTFSIENTLLFKLYDISRGLIKKKHFNLFCLYALAKSIKLIACLS